MLYKEDSNVCRYTYLRSFSIRHLNCSSFLQHIGALSFTIRHEFQTFLIYQQVQLVTSTTLFCSGGQRKHMLQKFAYFVMI